MGLIYKATSPSGKVYIGKTIQTLEKRKRGHKKIYFNKNSTSYNTKFARAIRKYEFDNFKWEIIEKVHDEFLNDKEIYYIKKYNSFNEGYNSTTGGDGPTEVSLETRKKIRESKLGKPSNRKGKKHTKETKEKMSLNSRGKNSPWYGKKHSETTKKKMSEAAIERWAQKKRQNKQ